MAGKVQCKWMWSMLGGPVARSIRTRGNVSLLYGCSQKKADALLSLSVAADPATISHTHQDARRRRPKRLSTQEVRAKVRAREGRGECDGTCAWSASFDCTPHMQLWTRKKRTIARLPLRAQAGAVRSGRRHRCKCGCPKARAF